MNNVIKTGIFILLVSLFACNNKRAKEGDVVLARVDNNYLNYSNIAEYITPGISTEDSLQFVQSFINSWVRNQILVQHAENNLPDSLKNFERQLEEYRNSLLLFQFKKMYVSQQLDTVVTDAEIEDFYQQHIGDFELKESIVRFSFIQMDQNSPQVAMARDLFKNLGDTTISKLEVENFCLDYGIDYFTDDEKWIRFNDLIAKIPITTYDKSVFLRNNRFVEVHDKPYVYFVYIKAFKVADELSPIEFERDKISKIILNKRKVDLIDNMENALFERAFQQKSFEIY